MKIRVYPIIKEATTPMSFHLNQYRYCPECATPLIQGDVDGVVRVKCPSCRFIYWGEFSIGVGGIVWREDRVLLVQRAKNPGKGHWTIPGGYVEQTEKIEDAVSREILEETGVVAQPFKLIGLRDRPGEKHDEYIIFLMEYLEGEPEVVSDEVTSTGFFTLDECLNLEVSDLTLHMIKASRRIKQSFNKVEGVNLIGERSTLYHG